MLDLFGWLLRTAGGVFGSLYDLIVCAVKQALCWWFGWLVDHIDTWLLGPVFALIPPPPSGWQWEFLAGLYGTANHYAPVSEGLLYGGVYGVCWATLVAYRIIKHHIPGLS